MSRHSMRLTFVAFAVWILAACQQPVSVASPLPVPPANPASYTQPTITPVLPANESNGTAYGVPEGGGTAGLPAPIPTSAAAMHVLQYLAERESAPLSEFMIGADMPITYPTLGLVYQFVAIALNQPGNVREFHFLVDPASGAIEPDIATVEQAERNAYVAEYGKLEPRLYDYLQRTAADQSLPVVIGAALPPGTLPEGMPDPSSLVEDTTARVDPLLTWLAEQGINAQQLAPDIALVGAKATKAQIQTIAASPLVSVIYLDDAVVSPAQSAP